MRSVSVGCATALLASATVAQGQPQIPTGMSLSAIRSTITSIEGVTIAKEQVVSGQTWFVVTALGVPFVFSTYCDDGGASCRSMRYIGTFPKNISTSAENINDYNFNSTVGWLATDRDSGALVARSSTILWGNTAANLRINITTFIGFYATIGEVILKDGNGGLKVSLDGVEVDPRERIVDVSHQPASTFSFSPEIKALLASKETEAALSKILSDPNAYGRLRKIANDVYGK